uniref:FAD/NAD(P)-binding domain-containing protein n=1 Tax=Aureoumbra lagunensis TaxID=44058 RepID=A0A7S3K387_9STRA
MLRKKIAVVGAGPSGLVTAKVLQSRGHEVVVIEKECSVGGAFRWRSYEDSRMVSSKYLTAFSDLRIPASADTHLTLDDYVKYLEAYTKKFNIEPIFSTVVESIEKEGEGYVVTCKNANSEWSACYDAVAICSGLHTYPRLVPIEKEHVETMHSANYTSGKNIFQKKRVIIVGTGETAFDAGWAAANNGAKHVTMITRTGFVSIPAELSKALPPLDTILANFGTHAWESNWSRNYSFHWWITTKLNRLGMLLTTGSSIGFNQYCGRSDSMTWDEGRKHVVNKATKCMALLNRPVKTGYFERFFFWLLGCTCRECTYWY